MTRRRHDDAGTMDPVVFEQPLMAGSGWGTAQGTSISAPLVADAAQRAGHRLGVLGPAHYEVHGAADGITDVTSGTDTIPGMAGFTTMPGYDLPPGWERWVMPASSPPRWPAPATRHPGPSD